MKQRGGEIIGSGSQGCIFAPKLEPRNEGGRVIASRSGNNASISKVFYNKDVWEGEYKIMQTVGAVTGGQGVVIFTREDTPFYEANNLNPANKTQLKRDNIGSACVKLKEIKAGQKYYILNQPRILGDLQDFKEKPGKPGKTKTTKPPSYFVPAYTALIRMQQNRLVHMDIASRNIFYDAEQALIGDFGYTINLRGEPGQLKASLDNFAKSHGLDNIEVLDVVDAFNADQLTPEAFMALSIMLNWKHKDRYLQYFKSAISQINRRFVEWTHDPVNPGKNARGYIVFNGAPYQKYLEVIENARIMNEDEFKIYAESVLLKSDIKRYIIVITQFLEIKDTQKYELLDQILNHDNFNFFYELAGVRVPDDLAAGAGSVAGSAAASGGGGGGSGTISAPLHSAAAAAGGAGKAAGAASEEINLLEQMSSRAPPATAAAAGAASEEINLDNLLEQMSSRAPPAAAAAAGAAPTAAVSLRERLAQLRTSRKRILKNIKGGHRRTVARRQRTKKTRKNR